MLASVAAILLAIWPDLPTPQTTTRPRHSSSSLHAVANAAFSEWLKAATAAASAANTRLATSSNLKFEPGLLVASFSG